MHLVELNDARKNGTAEYSNDMDNDSNNNVSDDDDLSSEVEKISSDSESLHNPYEYHGYYVYD